SSFDRRDSGRSGFDRRDSDRRSEKRSSVDCPVYNRCGGCSLRHVSYKDQLAHKQDKVNQLLCNYGYVSDIIGMENPYHYRNKVHATFGRLKNGTYISGVYEEGTHFIVPIESCLIEDEKADAIVGTIRGLLKSFKIRTYDEDSGYGLLRHVLIRTGHKSGEIMVVLVLADPILPSKNNFVKALRKEHPEITTVVINVNDKKTSMVLGDKQTTIYGKGFIEDELCGCTFRISPKSFYQVNPIQTEILYNKAIELAELTGNERVIDAYCGIGTIGMIASKHVKEVIGVELNKDAVRDAVVNAKANGIKNISFYNNDAGKFMVELAEQNEHVDVVFMDPPRAGSDEAFLSSVVTLAPDKVVYVSCSPETLDEDLAYLTDHGYKARKIVPVDMFPWTSHVETIVMLTKVK
ncbi:MAG: 23S rRNA (uracil(1939)-C(5))-methyltransferase RlmD, partial [bacterium]|nr:23S rRNA (uracil(1939)-C(5))-methyltransferase RlmD [bacterium]